MEYRLLGRSGLKTSVFSFGAMTFGGSGMFKNVGATQLADARKQIDLCLDYGVNLFDTADIYSTGQSEEILGEALGKERRKQVLLATKAFASMGEGINQVGLSRHHLIEACEASLRRMKTDWIDLYQVHNFDSLTPQEETLRALDDLVRQGKVRYIGCSNYAGWQLMKALSLSEKYGWERYITQQIQYSLMVRDSEDELLPLGVSEGVGALLWSPLAQGFLSGKFRGTRPGEGGGQSSRLAANGQLERFATERGNAVLNAVEELAKHYPGATSSQVSLNYLRRKAGVTSIILGARTEEQLRDNLDAAKWSMTDEDVAILDEASKTPMRYPYSHHANFGQGRNHTPPLLPR